MRNNSRNAVSHSRRRAVPWLALSTLALLLLWPVEVRAQQDPAQQEELEGINQGGYNIKQSIEFGGRLVDISGNENLYNTFVNLQQGARLLAFTTEMRSLEQHGSAFDRLYLSSFGYGGDPNDDTRLRVSKNRWYNFDVNLRRDQNAWDYSLLANPLNPTAGFVNGPPGFGPLATSTCTGCIFTNSPHLMDTRRYLSDYNLLILPESKVRVRMGYARNILVGPALSSVHFGTDGQLFQDVHTTLNTYHLGVDYRAAPRTNISYDQIWTDYKGDTGTTDQNQTFLLPNGTPVDLGIPFNATLQAMGSSNQPCNNTFNANPLATVSTVCNGFINYFTHGRVRTSTPTEQASFQSNYWKPVDISGHFSYTQGDARQFGYVEQFLGRSSNNLLAQNTNGFVKGQRVAASGDLGATWYITDSWRFLDSFHYSNFHDPMQFDPGVCAFFSPNMITPANAFAPTSPVPLICTPPAFSPVGTPAHTSGSAPDISIQTAGRFLKQRILTNLAEVDYQHSWRFGARAGFRYTNRDIHDNSFAEETDFYFPANALRGNCPTAATPGCTALGTAGGAATTFYRFVTPTVTLNPGSTNIDQYSGLFGVWAKPVREWRISFDMELMSADNVFTRISPRQFQEYRVRSTYKPVSWFHLAGTVAIWEGRDNVFMVNNLQHTRAYGVAADFIVNEKLSFDVGYNYDDVFSQIIICYPGTPIPGGPNQCATVSGLVEQLSVYKNKSQYGSFGLYWTPIRHLTAHLGGNFTGTSGSALNLNPNQEPGPLNSKWLVPTGGLDYAFTKNWMGRAYWNYYGYHEDFTNVPQDIYAPRNFHANTVTLSVRYAF